MLKRVKIRGYKSLADVEVHLQPLSVLFGPNASGKSNFLDALQLLSRIANSNNLKEAFHPPYRGTPLESFTFGSDGIQGLLRQEKLSFSIEVDVELSESVINSVKSQYQTTKEVKTTDAGDKVIKDFFSPITAVVERHVNYVIDVEMIPKSGILRLSKELLTVINAEGQTVYQLKEENQESSLLSKPVLLVRFPTLTAIREELASWLFFYLEPRERMRLSTPVKEVRHIGIMGEDLAAFLNTLRSIDEPQFRAVEKALHVIIPSVTGIDISVNNHGNVELGLMQGQTTIPAELLSEGTLRILGLLALGGAKESPALLGFEEPENGINPERLDLIAEILKNLASNETQVIVTTHSPTLLDLIPEESLYLFRQVNGNTVITSLPSWKAKKRRSSSSNTLQEETRTASERLLRGDFYA